MKPIKRANWANWSALLLFLILLTGCKVGPTSQKTDTAKLAGASMALVWLGNLESDLISAYFSAEQSSLIVQGAQSSLENQGLMMSSYADLVALSIIEGAQAAMNNPLFETDAQKITANEYLIDSLTTSLAAETSLEVSSSSMQANHRGPNFSESGTDNSMVTITELMCSASIAGLAATGMTDEAQLIGAMQVIATQLVVSLDKTGISSAQKDSAVAQIASAAVKVMLASGLPKTSLGTGIQAVMGGVVKGLTYSNSTENDEVVSRLPNLINGVYSGLSGLGLSAAEVEVLSTDVQTGATNSLSANGYSSDQILAVVPAINGAIESGKGTAISTAGWIIQVDVSAPYAQLPQGSGQNYKATAVYSDGHKEDVTSKAIWTSSRPDLAFANTTSAPGRVQSKELGRLEVQATFHGVVGTMALDVVAAELIALEVSPPKTRLPLGASAKLKAMALYTNAIQVDVSRQAEWISSDPSVLVVDNALGRGRTSAIKISTANVAASFQGKTHQVTITVTPAELVRLRITPQLERSPIGLETQYQATGIYSDYTEQDLTSQVTWSSSVPIIGSIDANGLFTAKTRGAGQVKASIAQNGVTITGTSEPEVTGASILRLQVNPLQPEAAEGLTSQLTAIALYSDQSTADVTKQAVWSSADQSMAWVGNSAQTSGLAKVLQPGPTEITATLNGVSDTTTLQGSASKVTQLLIHPEGKQVPKGVPVYYKVFGLLDNGSKVDLTNHVVWVSSNAAVATIGAGTGRTRTSGVGNSQISVSYQRPDGQVLQASTGLSVSTASLVAVRIESGNKSYPLGVDIGFQAMGHYSDNSVVPLTDQVSWESSNPAVFDFSRPLDNWLQDGRRPKSKTIGSAGVNVWYQGKLWDQRQLTITAAVPRSLAITPNDKSGTRPGQYAGQTQQFRARIIYSDSTIGPDVTNQVTWSSSNVPVAGIGWNSGSLTSAANAQFTVLTITATHPGFPGNPYFNNVDQTTFEVNHYPYPRSCLHAYQAPYSRSTRVEPILIDPDGWGSAAAPMVVNCLGEWTEVSKFNNGFQSNMRGAWENTVGYGGRWYNYKLSDAVIEMISAQGTGRIGISNGGWDPNTNSWKGMIGGDPVNYPAMIVIQNTAWDANGKYDNGFYAQYFNGAGNPVTPRIWTYTRPHSAYRGIDTYQFSIAVGNFPTLFFLWSDWTNGVGHCMSLPCRVWAK